MVKISFSEKLSNEDNAAFWCHLCPKLTYYPKCSAMCQKELPAELIAMLTAPASFADVTDAPQLTVGSQPTNPPSEKPSWMEHLFAMLNCQSAPPGPLSQAPATPARLPLLPRTEKRETLKSEAWFLFSVYHFGKLQNWNSEAIVSEGLLRQVYTFLKPYSLSLAWMGAAWEEILTSE